MNTHKMNLSLAVEFNDDGSPDFERTKKNFEESWAHMIGLLVYTPDVIGELVTGYFLKYPGLKSETYDSLEIKLWRGEEKAGNGRVPDPEEDTDSYSRVKSHFEDALRSWFKAHSDCFEITKGARGVKTSIIVRHVPGEFKLDDNGSPILDGNGQPKRVYRCAKDEWNLILLARQEKAAKKALRQKLKAQKNGGGISDSADDSDDDDDVPVSSGVSQAAE